jgi:hypothetical protein
MNYDHTPAQVAADMLLAMDPADALAWAGESIRIAREMGHKKTTITFLELVLVEMTDMLAGVAKPIADKALERFL